MTSAGLLSVPLCKHNRKKGEPMHIAGQESTYASSVNTAISRLAPVSIIIDHSHFSEKNGELICMFSRKYDQYTDTVIPRAHQLASASSPTKHVRPVGLKFCVNVDFLETKIALGFFRNVSRAMSSQTYKFANSWKSSKIGKRRLNAWDAGQECAQQTSHRYGKINRQGARAKPFSLATAQSSTWNVLAGY